MFRTFFKTGCYHASILPILLATPLAAQSQWTWRNPLPQGDTLLEVVYAQGQYVAAGNRGTILTSSDGNNWVPQKSGTGRNLRAVSFGNNTYLAAGFNGTILTSTDALTWKQVASGTTTHLRSALFADNAWYVVGDSGIILASSDGTSWTSRTSGTKKNLVNIQYFNNTFLIGGNNLLLYSPDGITWNAVTGLKDYDLVQSIAYADTQFVAVGGDEYYNTPMVYTSHDGASWVRKELSGSQCLNSVAFHNGRFAAVGDYRAGTVLTSTDGVLWTRTFQDSATVFKMLSYVIYANDQFVTVGGAGLIYSSPDGIVWTKKSIGPVYTFQTVNFIGDKYFASTTEAVIMTSTDGITWQEHATGMNNALYFVVFGNGKYCSIGYNGSIAVSTDGTAWEKKSSGTTKYLNSGIWAEDRFLCIGQSGTMLASADGDTWSIQPSVGSEDLIGIVNMGDQYVMAAASCIYTSPDGSSWTRRTIPTGVNELTSLTYGNNRLVAVGTSGAIIYSDDGITWTKTEQRTTVSLTIVSFGKDRFVAVGYNGTILFSYDGIEWYFGISGTENEFTSVACGTDQMVAVGVNGMIKTSPYDEITGIRQCSLPRIPEKPLAIQFVNHMLRIDLPVVKINEVTTLTISTPCGRNIFSSVIPIRNGTIRVVAPQCATGLQLITVSSGRHRWSGKFVAGGF